MDYHPLPVFPFALSVNTGVVMTHELQPGVLGLVNSRDSRPMRGVVKSLLDKLGDEADSPKYIFTELGVGYQMATGEAQKQDKS